MANKIEIPIDANIKALEKKVDDLGRKFDKVGKKKWDPIDPGSIERDARKAEGIIVSAQRRISERARGSGTRGGPDDAGESGGVRHGIRRRWHSPVSYGEVPQAFVGGFGGGLGQISSTAVRGLVGGASEGGGIMSRLGGLLKGTAIGALAYGAFKVGSAASEGMDMARERAQSLDTLKRQMGDVGVSFERLKVASEGAAYGLGMNSKDFAAFEARLNVASRGTIRLNDLADSANVVAGTARSFGMDTNNAASVFGGIRNVNPRQSYREFAVILAETIDKSSMASRSDEVAQAMLSFSVTASRLSLATPNLGAFGGAYSSLLSSGITGMTPEAAQGMLGQANSAMSQMGAAGEAGQALILAAMQHSGVRMNPLEAAALAGGGVFGTRASVFGPDSAYGKLLGKNVGGLASGPGSKISNFDLVRSQVALSVGRNDKEGIELQAEMMKYIFGLQTSNQAAALMKMDDSTRSGLGAALEKAGVPLDKINFTNLQTVAKIGNAGSMGALDAIYGDMRTRTGTSALDDGDIEKIEKAKKSNNIDDFRSALLKASSSKDYTQDTYVVMQESKAVLDDIKTNIGDKLVGTITSFQDSMIDLLGGKKKLDSIRKMTLQDEANTNADVEFMAGEDSANMKRRAQGLRIGDMPFKDQFKATRDADADYQQTMATLRRNRDHEKADPTWHPDKLDIHVHVHQDQSGKVVKTQVEKGSISSPRGAGAH